MNFTLRELEAFLDVARLGSFTRAARSLNMSQPALTVRIRHLEEALGVRLLDRTTRSVALTQIGREFLPVVARVLGEIDAVAVNARDVAGRRRGVVTVAALPSAASTLLPAIIAAFKARHRGIVVRLRDGVAQRVTALRARVIEHPMLVREISLIESTRRSLSPAAQQFLEAVRQGAPRRIA